ncbi:hypothetical protein P691DRAFT_810105 [Macrolepiota fuliginosa MF-IS2]|uniref:Uncharacterized protein n=1 Tax=Macrolepiota fuliginosa MF-IS2 TaxID=1400762 RepID=A0A9P5XFP9_9AGAR|nr:hypothetical protein P691DRAFT_810105 [Macrolepiota fuliginosa MF-IS2]
MMAATSSPRPSVISGSPSDASSLRAAALKTLKMGKRRRPASGQTQIVPLARAVPQDTLQLDYGQDDNTPESPRALPKVPSPPVSPHRDTSSVPHNARDMDVDMREEGEISDEDISPVEVNSFKPAPDNADDAINSISNDQPSVPTSRSGSPMPALLTRLSIPQSPATISPTPSIPYAERARSFPALDINQGSIMASPATYFSNGSPQERSPFPRESSNRSVSPGSGNSYVPAHGPQNYEMFVDRHDIHPGLSMTQTEYDAAKDIVLDLLGWGVPPHYLVDCGLSKELVFYVFRDLRLRLPSNLALHGALHEFETSSSGSPVHVEDPSANQLTSRIDGPVHNLRRPTPDPTTPLTDAPTVAATPTPEELEDMERRRRQELLARKEAVLASRKEKRPDTDSSIVHPSGESDSDVIMAPPAPTETVEDFLKSISPAKQGDVLALEQTTIETSLRDMDGMETDEIPGLCSSRPSFAVSPSPTSSQYLTPPSSGDSITSFSAQVQLPSEFAFNRPSRNRGTRRPVASDFVDVEDGHPSTSGFGSSAIKRKLQSGMNFSNIGMRRCIIDLSDSEDDEHDFEFLKRSQTAPALRAGQNFNVSRVSASSPAPAATTKARSSTVTPSPEASALELQILKMREEIAQKEQNRKRKALAKLNTTPSANTPYSTTPISGELVSREQSVHPQTHALARPTTPPISVSDSGSVYQDLSNIPDDIILVTSPIGSHSPGEHNRRF